jgi:peptidyl-prolyl cis-trans isomerase D
MLQTLREKTKGWIAVAILILLIIPFAFFGVENYFAQSVATHVAKVNDVEIGQDQFRQEFEKQRNQMRQMLGERYDPTQFETPEMRRQLLDRMIDEEVVRQASTRLGIVVSPTQVQKEIAAIPSFQVEGRFDPTQYRQTLQGAGYTPRSFEQEVIRGLSTRALPQQVMAVGLRHQCLSRPLPRAARPDPFVQVRGAADAGWRTAWARLPMPTSRRTTTSHPELYVNPESVSVEYIEIEAAKLDVAETVDESTLQAALRRPESRAYVEPAQRQAAHILVQMPANADADAQKAAEARAADIAAKARAEGADFAALAEGIFRRHRLQGDRWRSGLAGTGRHRSCLRCCTVCDGSGHDQ